jgi:antitoxin component YwqK of YwqJK toxin-antitoxin module
MMRFIVFLLLFISFNALGQKQHYADFYEGSKKRSEGFYERGLENGRWTWWYENENIKEVSSYFYGLLNGPTLTYYDNGNLKQEGYFIKGVQDSLMRSFSRDSVLMEEGLYLEGQKTGTWNYWFESGELMLREAYTDSIKEVRYFKTKKEELLVDGTGVYMEWYADSVQKVETH